MDPEEAPMSRNAAFGQGIAGTASLAADSERQNDEAYHAFTPTSVLHQIMLSPNGYSAHDAQRRLLGGGLLPTVNSMSPETNEASRPIISKYTSL